MKDSTFTKVLTAVILTYSSLMFALSTFAYLNLESLPIHSVNSVFGFIVAIAIGAGILQFPSVVMYAVTTALMNYSENKIENELESRLV